MFTSSPHFFFKETLENDDLNLYNVNDENIRVTMSLMQTLSIFYKLFVEAAVQRCS